ncbi:MAG: hypothetical protein ACR2O6_05650 [Ilumatobacteraceae bacterium]
MNGRRTLAAVAGLALLASACGGGSDSGSAAPGVDATVEPAAEPAPEPPAEPASEAAEPAAEPATVPAALQFSAPLVGGGEIDAATLAGKPTVFWFWAPT